MTYVSMVRRTYAVAATLLAILLLGTALAQEGVKLIVVADIVVGRENIGDESMTCTPLSRFKHEQQVVWRAKVIDPMTGEEMSDEQLTSVEVVLVDGQVFEMEFGEHPRQTPVDAYWTTNWVIPADYPSGIVDYTVEATASDGRSGELVVFPIESSALTVLPE